MLWIFKNFLIEIDQTQKKNRSDRKSAVKNRSDRKSAVKNRSDRKSAVKNR